jgi:hypothetical protein
MNVFKMGLHAFFLGTQRMVWFYDNGHLQQALLSRDFTIQGRIFKKGDVIYFGSDGIADLTAKKLQ